MIRVVCDNCGKTLIENDKTINDYREIQIEIARNEVIDVMKYHLCYDHCVDRFKELIKRFMSE